MFTRRRLILASVLTAALALPAAAAFAGGREGGHFHRGFGDEPKSAQEVRDHLGLVTDHLLDRVDATDAQRANVDKILDKVAPDIYKDKLAAHDLRKELKDELTASKIDKEQIETTRKAAMDLADDASKTVLAAVEELADTLTPTQRQQVADAIARHMSEEADDDGPRGDRRGPSDPK